ncbi:MAG TPA: hypothetical protein VL357_11030 [Rariglobus sp.]|jgi:hypothetical protein|nr:hypothetical protein [Rariglobus sp.]
MKPYLRVTLVYAVFGVLWIFLSDRLVGMLTDNLEGFTFLQTMKGWVFVILSSVLIFFITKRACDDQLRTEREKMAVFNKTVEGSCHILLNYLNQMQLVTIEAERIEGFDRKVLEIAHAASDEATAELIRLRDIQTVTAENIDAVVYEKIRRPPAK